MTGLLKTAIRRGGRPQITTRFPSPPPSRCPERLLGPSVQRVLRWSTGTHSLGHVALSVSHSQCHLGLTFQIPWGPPRVYLHRGSGLRRATAAQELRMDKVRAPQIPQRTPNGPRDRSPNLPCPHACHLTGKPCCSGPNRHPSSTSPFLSPTSSQSGNPVNSMSTHSQKLPPLTPQSSHLISVTAPDWPPCHRPQPRPYCPVSARHQSDPARTCGHYWSLPAALSPPAPQEQAWPGDHRPPAEVGSRLDGRPTALKEGQFLRGRVPELRPHPSPWGLCMSPCRLHPQACVGLRGLKPKVAFHA